MNLPAEDLIRMLSDLDRVDKVLALGEIAESETHYRVKEAVRTLTLALAAPLSKVPEIAELQKDTPIGCCCFCQDPIPGYAKISQRKQFKCQEPECEASYNRIFKEYRRKQLGAVSGPTQFKAKEPEHEAEPEWYLRENPGDQ